MYALTYSFFCSALHIQLVLFTLLWFVNAISLKKAISIIVTTGRKVEEVTKVFHSNDVIMSAMASQITSASIVYTTVCSGADQRKYQNSAPLAFVRGIYRWPVNSPHALPTVITINITTREIIEAKALILTSWSISETTLIVITKIQPQNNRSINNN